MAFKGHDGKNFGNRQQRDTYDKSKKPAAKESAEPEQDGGGAEDAGEGQMSLDEHMAQHGPAEKVEISHSEGKHTKTSHHGGKKHVSHHATADEAHMEGAKAAGVMPQEQEQQMQPMQPMGGMAGGIPGM